MIFNVFMAMKKRSTIYKYIFHDFVEWIQKQEYSIIGSGRTTHDLCGTNKWFAIREMHVKLVHTYIHEETNWYPCNLIKASNKSQRCVFFINIKKYIYIYILYSCMTKIYIYLCTYIVLCIMLQIQKIFFKHFIM